MFLHIVVLRGDIILFLLISVQNFFILVISTNLLNREMKCCMTKKIENLKVKNLLFSNFYNALLKWLISQVLNSTLSFTDTMSTNCIWLNQRTQNTSICIIYIFQISLDKWKCVQCIWMYFSCTNVGWRQLCTICQWMKKSYLKGIGFSFASAL